MQRKIRFTKKVIDSLPPCPADAKSSELEYSSAEAPPGLRLVINKRGLKSWLLRYVLKASGQLLGIKRAIKLGVYPGMDPGEACSQALILRDKINRGIDPLEERKVETVPESPTLNQFFSTTYFPHALTTLRSFRDIEARWRLHLAPEFGHLRFADLKPATILQFHDRKKVSTCPATANRLLALLKRVINVAVMLEVSVRNPARGIRMHEEGNIRFRTLSTGPGGELQRFLAALDSEPNQTAADFFLFCLATGARREEALRLPWNELNLGEQTWRIPEYRAKSKRSRVIPLGLVAMEILERRPKIPGNPYVFPGKVPGQPLVNPTKAFRRVLANAAISDFTIHDLRRTAATLLLNNASASVEQCRLLLGHQSGSMTVSRYAFLSQDRVREASHGLSAVLSEAMRPEAG